MVFLNSNIVIIVLWRLNTPVMQGSNWSESMQWICFLVLYRLLDQQCWYLKLCCFESFFLILPGYQPSRIGLMWLALPCWSICLRLSCPSGTPTGLELWMTKINRIRHGCMKLKARNLCGISEMFNSSVLRFLKARACNYGLRMEKPPKN